ncbi:MAG: hypothetical protein V7L23_15455 [Nostoc sp.]|uniref:hypothetical protein n=1 Tax=Nostoc sp. TaxID=1180 RepID=UPI002FF1D8F0
MAEEKSSPRITLPIDIFEALEALAKLINPALSVKSLVIQACVELLLEHRSGKTTHKDISMLVQELPMSTASEISIDIPEASAFADFEGMLDD